MANNIRDIQLIELKDIIAQLNIIIQTLNDTIVRQQTHRTIILRLSWHGSEKIFCSLSGNRNYDIAGMLNFFGNLACEEDKPVELIESEVVPASKKKRKKKSTVEEQFNNISTRIVILDTLSEEEKTCPLCGIAMVPIGTGLIRSEIVYALPKLERIEYAATTYAYLECKDTEEPQFIKDNGRLVLIPGSYVLESLRAYILYRKYTLYVPLYRQEKDFLGQAVPIGRNSMASWIITAGEEYIPPM